MAFVWTILLLLTISDGLLLLPEAARPLRVRHHALAGAGVFLVWATRKLLAQLLAERMGGAHLQLLMMGWTGLW